MTNRFILIANASDASLDILKEQVAPKPFTLLHAKDGKEAIAYLELLKSDIEVAIIALDLPLISGLDVIWHLLRQKRSKPAKIIATSASVVPELEAPLKEFGVHTVLLDPLIEDNWRKLIAELP